MNVEICRLCLKPTSHGNFDAIDDISTQMLNMLLLKLNLGISKNPVMCNACATILHKCFHFKSICVFLETKSLSFIKSEENDDLTLEDVHLKQENIELSDTSNDKKICHFCVKQNQLGPLITLNENKENMFLVNIVQKHIPEMNIEITQEILACETCIDSIQNLFNFVTQCLDVEERIIKYIETEGADDRGYIDLNKIQLTLPINKHETNCADMDVNKIKDGRDGKQDAAVNIKSKAIDINKLKFNLKIRLQGNNCKRALETTLVSGEYEECLSRNPSRREFKCGQCWYRGRTIGCFRQHMLRHKDSSEVEMHKCEICPFESRYISAAKRHLLVHKNPTEIAMYKCDLCTFEVEYRDGLRKHVLTHMLKHESRSEVIMYKCKKCPFKAKRKGGLKQHMLIHADPSEITMYYKCGVCTLQTKYKSNLKKHIMTVHKSYS